MTSDAPPTNEQPEHLKRSGNSRLAELGQMYDLGNKAALYDAIQVSDYHEIPLPKWAVEPLLELIVNQWRPRLSKWKGSKKPIDGGYGALIARYLRAEVYRTARAFTKNKNNYRILPTKCIQAWYAGDFKTVPDTAAGALEIAIIGLEHTIGECDITTLEKHRYFGADTDADKLVVDDPEGAIYLEMGNSEFADMIKSAFRDGRRLPISFGHDPTEVIFGLREDEQFWGPPSDPPGDIQKILDNEVPFISDDGYDFMEEN